MEDKRGPKRLFRIPVRWDRALSFTAWSTFFSLLSLFLYETIHVFLSEGLGDAYRSVFQTGFLLLGVLGWALLLGSLPVSWLLADVKRVALPQRQLIGLSILAGWSAAALSFALYNTIIGLSGIYEPILLDAHYSMMFLSAGAGSSLGYYCRAVRLVRRRKWKRKRIVQVSSVSSRGL